MCALRKKEIHFGEQAQFSYSLSQKKILVQNKFGMFHSSFIAFLDSIFNTFKIK